MGRECHRGGGWEGGGGGQMAGVNLEVECAAMQAYCISAIIASFILKFKSTLFLS